MDKKVISICLSLSLMLLYVGCAGKNVSSSSGDQSGQALGHVHRLHFRVRDGPIVPLSATKNSLTIKFPKS